MSTDPTALAREVLDAAHEDETVTVCTIPDNTAAALARAVIELTARLDAERFAHANAAMRIKCVEALADRLDAAGLYARNHPDADVGLQAVARADRVLAARIRAALNGGDK